MSVAPSAASAHAARRAAPRRLGLVRARAARRARRRGGRPAARAARRPPSTRVALRYVARRRAARRRGGGRRGDGDRHLVARDVPGRRTRDVATAGCSPAATTGYAWLNGAGRRRGTTSPDADDFVVSVDPARPGLAPRARSSTRSSPTASPRAGVDVERARLGRCRRAWDELPTGRGRDTPHELYGGDLRGIEQHLDHVERARRERRST